MKLPPIRFKSPFQLNRTVSGLFTLQSSLVMCFSCQEKTRQLTCIITVLILLQKTLTDQGHPTTVFCKTSVRRSEYCQE